MEIKQCAAGGCPNSFGSRKPWQRFCSPECRDLWHCAKRKAERAERKVKAVLADPTVGP